MPGMPRHRRVVVGEGAPGHERGDHRQVEQLGQLTQRLGGPRLEDAAAGVDDRPLGEARISSAASLILRGWPWWWACSPAGRRPPRRRSASTTPWPSGGWSGRRCPWGCRPAPARAAGGGDVERLADGPGDVLGLGDQEVVLGDRLGDAGDVGLLEGVGADGHVGTWPVMHTIGTESM
jgi:hypothetical protein